ncbi:MAG: hypothetical protein ACTH6O_00490 [Vibrio toranzoniae]
MARQGESRYREMRQSQAPTPAPVVQQPSALDGDNHVAYQGGDKGYSNTMAAITRQQYNDWLTRFAPTEEKLIDLATSGELYAAQENRNQSLAQSNLSRAENQAASTGAKFGLGDLRTDQQKNNLKINNALSLASMNNEGRQALGDLQNSLISGVSNSKGQQINKLGEA